MTKKIKNTMVNLILLKSIQIFREISESTLNEIAQCANICFFKKDTLLFGGGERLKQFFYVLHGWAKVFRETYEGNEVIIDMVDTLLDARCFSRASIFDKIIEDKLEAITDTEMLVIPITALKYAIKKDHKFSINLLQDAVDHKTLQENEIEHLSAQNALQRIGCFLLKLYNTQPKQENVIRLPFQKSLLATRLGMRPETFSRELTKLCEKADMTLLKNNSFLLHSIEKLKRFACYNCSKKKTSYQRI